MARTKKVVEEVTIKEEIAEIKCTMCGEIKKANANNFYKSYSILFKGNYENRMCLCKSCITDLYEKMFCKYGTNGRALYECCKMLDVYYELNLYNSALKQFDNKTNGSIISVYFQKVNSLPQYKNKTFIDSDLFNKEVQSEELEQSVERNVIDFWGEGLLQNDYEFLEKEFDNLTNRYECDSYAQEVLFQEIAFQRLDIKKKRSGGSSVDKELKTLQDLLGSANIKPAQENASMASEQVTFGTLIKKYENEKPVPEPLPEWMTENWIKKYVCTWFLGNLCRMMGKSNPFKEDYENEMDAYTVKVDEEGEE